MEQNPIGLTDKLTYKEAISIIKAVTAYNDSKIEFMHNYLKYANELEIHVARDKEMISIQVSMPKEG